MGKKKVVYAAAFVEDVVALREALGLTEELGNKLHHITFAFKPDAAWVRRFFEEFPPGTRFEVVFRRLVAAQATPKTGGEGRISALSVDEVRGVGAGILGHVASGVPHLTVGVTPGVAPALAGPLTAGVDHEQIVAGTREVHALAGVTASVRIGWFDGREDRFDEPPM